MYMYAIKEKILPDLLYYKEVRLWKTRLVYIDL